MNFTDVLYPYLSCFQYRCWLHVEWHIQHFRPGKTGQTKMDVHTRFFHASILSCCRACLLIFRYIRILYRSGTAVARCRGIIRAACRAADMFAVHLRAGNLKLKHWIMVKHIMYKECFWYSTWGLQGNEQWQPVQTGQQIDTTLATGTLSSRQQSSSFVLQLLSR